MPLASNGCTWEPPRLVARSGITYQGSPGSQAVSWLSRGREVVQADCRKLRGRKLRLPASVRLQPRLARAVGKHSQLDEVLIGEPVRRVVRHGGRAVQIRGGQ